MKKRFNYLLAMAFILPTIFSFVATNQYKLTEAMVRGLVKCTIHGNSNSTHYYQPIVAVLKNSQSTPLTVTIGPGDQFFPADPSLQNMLVTSTQNITLNPGQKLEVPIYAMCTEAHDGAPTGTAVYSPAKPAPESLIGLAKIIDKNKLHTYEGQQAVWCISDKEDLENLTGYDTATARMLLKYVAKATGRPIPPKPKANDYVHNFYYSPPDTSPSVFYKGKIHFNFSDTHHVTVGLFNTRNTIVRELYNKDVHPGEQSVEYAFDNGVYKDKIYFVRLISDGEVMVNRQISFED